MSAMKDSSEPRSDVERLIQDMFDSDHVVFTITAGENLAVAELMGSSAPVFRGRWWTVETAGWHIHAQLNAIRRVRFVREASSHAAGQESLSIRLLGPNGESLLRCYFTNLYDERHQPITARFSRWEELRAKYVGQEEASVEDGAIKGAG